MNHGPVWLRPDVVVALHEEQVGEYGGPSELRHEGFLDAALARAYRLWEYECRDLPRLAAAYAAGIVQNLPFTAGNERTAFLSVYVFLARNGTPLARTWR